MHTTLHFVSYLLIFGGDLILGQQYDRKRLLLNDNGVVIQLQRTIQDLTERLGEIERTTTQKINKLSSTVQLMQSQGG